MRTEKSLFILEHIITIAIGLAAGVVSFVPLRDFTALGSEGAAMIGLFAALGALIIADRIFFQSRLMELREYIDAAILDSQGFEATSRYFESTNRALDYIIGRIPAATKIWNTRLQTIETNPTISDVQKRKMKQDELIAEAILAGASYEFICNQDFEDEIQHLEASYRKPSEKKGNLRIYITETMDQPLLQMMMLEYPSGGREALVGWVFDESGIDVSGVWVVRDARATEFFLKLFDAYKTRAIRRRLN